MSWPVFSFDTETFLISPGCTAPPMVCLQFTVDDGPEQIIHAKDPAIRPLIRWALEKTLLDGHNLAYDMGVLAAFDVEEFLELVFRAYHEDRATCTAIRQKLIDIASGCFEGDARTKWGYSLAECVSRVCGIELDKTDPWRLEYGTLYQTPVAQWPVEAVGYATGDITAQRALYYGQEPSGGLLADQYRQSRAAFMLHLTSVWGIRTDLEAIKKFHAASLVELKKDRAVAEAAQLVRPTGVRHMLPAKRRMVQVFRELEEEPALTDTGIKKQKEIKKAEGLVLTPNQIWDRFGDYISLDEDSCLASGDDILQAFQRFGSMKTAITRVERLYKGVDLPLQARFQPLVSTGRTSCRMGDVKPGQSPPSWGFQLQNIPRKPGLRECFIPRPGFVFCSVDYDGVELRTWAQVCLWAVGHSRLAQVLNEGLDPHTELGARVGGLSKAEAYALRKAGDKHFDSEMRQVAKIGNFGFMGGMGPKTLRVQARKEYRKKLSLQQCKALRANWKSEWPESVDYFRWVNSLVGDGLATVRHFKSDRVRGGIPYTVTCNTFFQGLASDAAKAAGWRLLLECYVDKSSPLYGSRIVDFIHDEYLLEVPEGEAAHHAAMRQAKIMAEEAQKWVPDVHMTCEPVLMDRWSKSAKTKYNADGMLIPHIVELAA